MSSSPEQITDTASSLIQREGGLVPFIRNVGFGGISYALILQIIEVITSGGMVLFGPIRALGRGIIMLVDGTFGALLLVLDAGTAATVASFVDGTARLLGPLAQPASVGIMMLTLGVFLFSVNRLEISPLAFVQSLRRG